MFLVFRLEEMEEKYLMRESKPEDIQMITELKAMLTERDQVIKKLIVRFAGGGGGCNHVSNNMEKY